MYCHLGEAGTYTGFPGGAKGKEPPANAGGIRDMGLIPGSRRFPEEENGNSLEYSCQENPRDRGAWWATVHRVTKSPTGLKRISMQELHITHHQ